ncbi:LacI family DNA-binding transcriptional regulator [Salsipaludibacter albus]|uniref:LacI family DNA-binding transcriptional regulator n=1 Tax=Salsipaludibacter albus TaxID=2849650 RepID=UPI001EE3A5A7|nr:LacI family transcriptional regulator [Salsipaludibacter albus]
MPATIDDVAALAGVSTATVSRALRGLPNVAVATREKVQRAADLLDYVADPAASALAAGRTATLGLVVPGMGRWAHARMLEVVQDRAGAAGYDVLPVTLASAAAREFFLTRHPFRRRVDGLVVAEVPLDGAELLRLGEGRPVAAIGLDAPEVDTVVADDARGIAEATTHLLSLGHVDIAFIGGGSSDARLVAPAARRSAFTSTLATAGIEEVVHRVVESQASSTGGAAALSLLLDEVDPPTAVIVASDEMALGAMEVARSRGLDLPGDLSVVGVDDQPVAQFVGLTTVHRDVARMAARACDWVLERLDGSDVPARHEVVATSLVKRGSTAPPRTR